MRNVKFYDSVTIPLNLQKQKFRENNDALLSEGKPTNDVVERLIGSIGPWQLKIYILMFIIYIPSSWVELGIELLANKTEFWCKFPKTNVTLINSFSQINSTEICKIQDQLNGSQTLCPYGYYYDISVIGTTIISEWDLVCDRKYLITVVQVLSMFGTLLGEVLFGFAADKYGRRLILNICCITRLLFGVLSAFSSNITTLIILRFILGFVSGGIPGVSLIMCVETLGGKWRLILSACFLMGFNFGLPIMALISVWLKNWRHAQCVLYLLTILSVFCAWVAPESPRWLLSVGKKSSAVQLLEKAAVTNGKSDKIVKDAVEHYKDKDNTSIGNRSSWVYLITIPKLRKRTIFSCLNGMILFTNVFGFYQLFGEFSNYPMVDLTIQGVTGIIGSLISSLVIVTCSRRHTLAFTSFIVGTSSLIFFTIPNVILRIVIKVIIFCCIGIIMSTLEPLTGELFPTVLRNSGFGIFSIFTNLGAVIAPTIVSLETVYKFSSIGIFSILSFLVIGFIYLLPDVKDDALDETIQDVDD